MSFNRPPRIQPSLPRDEVDIPGPAHTPTKPGSLNILSIGLPLGAVLLTVFLMSAGGGGGSYLRFLPIMLATYLATGLTYVFGNRNYKKELASAKEQYRQRLGEVEVALTEMRSTALKALMAVDPSPVEGVNRARNRDPRLGERRPTDPDFLTSRVGIGARSPSYALNVSALEKPPTGFEEETETARGIAGEFAVLQDAPIGIELPALGSIGLSGPVEQVADTARAMLSQIAVHHWPHEVLVACIARAARAGEWDWIETLPHAASDRPVIQLEAEGDGWLSELERELQQREQWLDARRQIGSANPDAVVPLPRLIVIFDGIPPDFKHSGLSLLLQGGKRLGAHAVFIARSPEQIPGECGAVILIKEGRGHFRQTGPDGLKLDFKPDRVTLQEAHELAGLLAAIDWPDAGDISRPPEQIGLLELFGYREITQLPLESWWQDEPPFGYLKAPIGKLSPKADLIFDLNDQDGSHGPHGLIGGMTGSGKSEALKTILLALAATHSPQDLNFALIDYKGGAAFNELAQLPHTVGVVTDIESHVTYSERVIQALAGEIEHRKRVLERARAAFGFGRSHIDEYRQLTVKRPLPRLVIVFDEFAEFRHRNPQESKRLISIARQGRSLGVHLILATQNIEAAVDPEILQNSTFRVCLRVSQAQDSVQMIGIPDAVNLPRGRAYFQAQSRRLFQVAYSGGDYRANGSTGPGGKQVRILSDGQERLVALPLLDGDGIGATDGQYTEAQALVDRISEAARTMRLRKPPPVWPDPLPERLYLPDILSRNLRGGWDGASWRPCQPWRVEDGPVTPVVGIYDQPAEQRQSVFRMDPEHAGQHLLCFGSSGTGKSTLIRSVVCSIAHTHSPDQSHVYILDFGGQSALKVLEELPHVGAVVTRTEEERVVRLLSFLQSEVSRRSELLRAAGFDSYRDFNARAAAEERLPTIHLVIDAYGEFKRRIPLEIARTVTSLVGGGAAVGLHLIISANLQADVPNELFANIGLRATFYQADQSEYFRIVGRPSEARIQEDIEHPPPPGRGLLRGTPPLQFQAALPVSGASDEEQSRNLGLMAAEMNAAWHGSRPAEIRTLPYLVTIPASSRAPALSGFLGLGFEHLAPIQIELPAEAPTFLVASVSPRSGKTTLMRSLICSLLMTSSPEQLQLVLVDFHSRTLTPFRGLPHEFGYIGTSAAVDPTFESLTEEIRRRQAELDKAYEKDPDNFDGDEFLQRWPRLLLAIDDYDRFSDRAEASRRKLVELGKSGSELGLSLLMSGNISDLPRDFDDPFMQIVRRNGSGVLLGGTQGIDQFNNARPPVGQPASGLPPGRGFLVRRGLVSLFQAAAYWTEGVNPDAALIERITTMKAVRE